MSHETFPVPDEILLAWKVTPEALASRIRRRGRKALPDGPAFIGRCRPAGVPKPYFPSHLADYGVN